MALANFTQSRSNSFKNDRGLDPRAMATLQAKKNSRSKREDELRRKQTEREINALKARLSVINRELQRLAVSERRYSGSEEKIQQEFERESRSLLELTKELGRHSEKVKVLQEALKSKKLLTHKSHISNDFGREAVQKEGERLKIELKRIDQEIDQLNSKKRRLVAEMSNVQQKIQKESESQSRNDSDMKNVQAEINKILQELQSEETVISRFKARFSVEQKIVSDKERQLMEAKKRAVGTSSGSPALENEKQKIEKKIRDLEQTLN